MRKGKAFGNMDDFSSNLNFFSNKFSQSNDSNETFSPAEKEDDYAEEVKSMRRERRQTSMKKMEEMFQSNLNALKNETPESPEDFSMTR